MKEACQNCGKRKTITSWIECEVCYARFRITFLKGAIEHYSKELSELELKLKKLLNQ